MFITGCRVAEEVEPQYDRPLPLGRTALRKITDPAQIPDFTIACYSLQNLQTAAENSLNYLGKPSSQQFFPLGTISHSRAVTSLETLCELLESGLMGKELNAAIRQKFDVYTSIGCDDKGTVLYTGYYTPIFDGALKPTGRFQYPLYSQPKDLVKGQNGEILGRRLPTGHIIRFPARVEIERSGMLKGSELIYLGDPFEVYIAHVQGSAKIRLPDGKLITVGYAANNGHEYNSVGSRMIKDNVIDKQKLSLSAMIEYFKNHPNEVAEYTSANPRYVFFRMTEGNPHGSLNEPVIPMRSIATDKAIYPRACLAFIATKLPRAISGSIAIRQYTGFALDQDAGGAIRAPGRCDVYMGIGDEAGMMAGQVYQEGRLYYLFSKLQK